MGEWIQYTVNDLNEKLAGEQGIITPINLDFKKITAKLIFIFKTPFP